MQEWARIAPEGRLWWTAVFLYTFLYLNERAQTKWISENVQRCSLKLSNLAHSFHSSTRDNIIEVSAYFSVLRLKGNENLKDTDDFIIIITTIQILFIYS